VPAEPRAPASRTQGEGRGDGRWEHRSRRLHGPELLLIKPASSSFLKVTSFSWKTIPLGCRRSTSFQLVPHHSGVQIKSPHLSETTIPGTLPSAPSAARGRPCEHGPSALTPLRWQPRQRGAEEHQRDVALGSDTSRTTLTGTHDSHDWQSVLAATGKRHKRRLLGSATRPCLQETK